jgi:co-chaperonin GroES (HSP10)
MKPIGNRVLVELEKLPDVIDGIYVPDRTIAESNIGKIIELGTGEKNKPFPDDIKVGMKCVFENNLDKISFSDNNVQYSIYRTSEILGVING